MMRLLPLGLICLFTGTVLADEAGKKILKELEGNYTPTAMTRSGEPAPDEFLKTVSFAVKGETFVVKFAAGTEAEEKKATAVIDSKQKPMAIDLTPTDGPEAGKPMLGIIKIEKDTVTVCWTDRGEKTDRPTEFTSTKENRQFLIVMKRSK